MDGGVHRRAARAVHPARAASFKYRLARYQHTYANRARTRDHERCQSAQRDAD